MAKWNTVRTSVGRAASKAIHKTGEVVDTTSLYVKLKTAQAKLDGYYTALGKLTFKQLETGESQAEKIATTLECIREKRQKVRALRNKIAVERAKRKTTESQIIIETAIENAKEEASTEA